MKHALGFMEKTLDFGHAEKAPELDESTECWYLPLFAVYYPKKPGSVRCVFDPSAKFEGVSFNDVLLTGPDLVNSSAISTRLCCDNCGYRTNVLSLLCSR
jgi:hypothetical protein